MRVIGAEDLARTFTFPLLIEALRKAFRSDIEVPLRHHHPIERPGEPAAMLLLMPAWQKNGGYLGVKVVSFYPGNAARSLPSVSGTYLLMRGDTGAPLAVVDGQALTLWRTAAASALAASYLARKDASRLLMVGAGALAPYLIEAHASVSPIAEALVWNHNPSRAEAIAARLSGRAYSVRAITDLESGVRGADVISCATLSSEPLVRGAWLRPGAHLDLVGAFTPKMRESDDEAVRRATVYVDTRSGALHEAGDIVQPLAAAVIRAASPATFSTSAVEEQRPGGSGRDHPVQIRRDSARGTWPPPLSLSQQKGNLSNLPSQSRRRPWRSSAAIWRGPHPPPHRTRVPGPRGRRRRRFSSATRPEARRGSRSRNPSSWTACRHPFQQAGHRSDGRESLARQWESRSRLRASQSASMSAALASKGETFSRVNLLEPAKRISLPPVRSGQAEGVRPTTIVTGPRSC
jgi:ornithine cyclodeaminase